MVSHRCGIQLMITTGPSSADQKTVEGIVTDVSVGGLGLNSAEKVGANAVVVITFDSSIFHGEVRARVAWCGLVPTTGRVLTDQPRKFRIGIEFLPETEEQEKFVKELIADL